MLPSGATPFTPLGNYSAWWSMTEACSGLNRPMSSVSWYTVPGDQFAVPGDTVNGYYDYDHDAIVFGSGWNLQGDVIRHEMLHALIHQAKGTSHPREYFLEKCAGVVWCNEFCVATSDPPPVPALGTPVVTVDSLELSITVEPADITIASYGNLEWAAVTVTARNPLGHDVIVSLPPEANQVYAPSFAYITTGFSQPIAGLIRAYDSEGTLFRAGESKRGVFDLYAFEGLPARFGTYQATGTFGGRAAVPATFRVVP